MAKADEHDAAFWRRQEQDYYALLGVGRDASAEEIRAQFLTLSREFHPDRTRNRQDPDMIALANTQYPILDRAYKVLSDPTRRQAYDMFGERVRSPFTQVCSVCLFTDETNCFLQGVMALEDDANLKHVLGQHFKTSNEVYAMHRKAFIPTFFSPL